MKPISTEKDNEIRALNLGRAQAGTLGCAIIIILVLFNYFLYERKGETAKRDGAISDLKREKADCEQRLENIAKDTKQTKEALKALEDKLRNKESAELRKELDDLLGKSKPSPPSTQPPPQPLPRPPAEEQSKTVYITNTGERYHQEWCRYLKSKIAISLKEAQKRGYTPCKVCEP